MELIFQIAIGIVLGVILLAFLREIMALGLIVLLVAVALAGIALVVVVIYVIGSDQDMRLVFLIGGAVLVLGLVLVRAPRVIDQCREFRQELRAADARREKQAALDVQEEWEATAEWQFLRELDSMKRKARGADEGETRDKSVPDSGGAPR